MSRRIYDLSKLDFEGNRKRKRRKLLLYSLPICVIAFLFMAKFLGMNIINSIVSGAMSKRDYSLAANAQSAQKVANFFEPYLAGFNLGNALYYKKEWLRSIDSYRESLNVVSSVDECRVRVNLTLALIGLAEDNTLSNKIDEAIVVYDEAKSTLSGGRRVCGVIMDGKTKEQADKEKADVKELEKYINQESNKLKSKRNDDEYESKESGDESESDTITSEQLEKLQEASLYNSSSRGYALSGGSGFEYMGRGLPKEPYW